MPKPQTRQQARQHARHQAKQQARQHPKAAAAATPSAQARTRQEKKEQARLQRDAIRKQMARRRRARLWTMVGVALAAVAAIVILVVVNDGSKAPVAPSALPGLQTGPPPWTNNTQDLDARLTALGLPPLSTQEALAFHIHQHLDIVVDGNAVAVPAQIGITDAGEFAVIHTHDTTGVIHVESPVQKDYTLADLFGVWGLRLTKSCIGGLCTNGTKTLAVYVNGKLVTGDPTKVVLSEHEEILVTYGTAAELPKPIPSSYQFPAGE
jgi:hypothetical protein